MTASDPTGQTLFIDDHAIESLSFVRGPNLIKPLLADAQNAAGIRAQIRYFFDPFRLRAPSLGLEVVSAQLVAAPAH